MTETTVTVQLEGDALGFAATWGRNLAQALFQLGVNGVRYSPLPGYRMAVTAATDEATILRAHRAASLALTRELESNGRMSYHAEIDRALTELPKRPTRVERQHALGATLHRLYHESLTGPSDEVKALYWMLANKTGVNPASHALLDEVERRLEAELTAQEG
jgi:hypothetical protein